VLVLAELEEVAEQDPPAGPDQPALQVQLVFTVLPIGESEPAGQSSQLPNPVTLLYFPATQAAHGPPSGPDEPALQVQLVKSVLPAGEFELDGQTLHVELVEAPSAVEYVPAPQAVHIADPVNALYFPATQAAHGPPSGPDEPALQVQLVKAVLPALEYFPASQSLHAADPVPVLNLPAVQATH
jgi:hypothetical protein